LTFFMSSWCKSFMTSWCSVLSTTSLLLAAILISAGCDRKDSPSAPTPPPSSEVEPLRSAADAAGRLVGTASQSGYLGDPLHSGTLGRHFNYLTAEYEMKWDAIERAPGVRTFSGGDALVAFAQSRGMQVKGHALIWHGSVPPWVDGLSPAEFRTVLENHIRAVADHYRGRVLAWDVVNEAVADSGSGLRDTIFRQKLGDAYIGEAFRLAREADPGALLFYNDYGGEGTSGKSDRIYNLLKGLLSQGVPIDGVGLQMHVSAANRPSDANIAANIRRLAALGLLVNISEMDVRIADLPGTTAARLETQRSVYRSIVGLCMAEPRCHAVTFWGFTDAYSWIDARYGPDDPLLFDDRYAPKPAFYGVLDALWRR
jgi:endo-1,4-beta-xylanase